MSVEKKLFIAGALCPAFHHVARRRMSGAQERELAAKARAGDVAAQQCLVEANLKVLVNAAYKHARHAQDIPDLIQEGVIPMIESLQRFDSTKAKFSTYAAWPVKDQVAKTAMRLDNMVCPTVYVLKKIKKIADAEKKLTRELRRQPTKEELAGQCGLADAVFEEAHRQRQRARISGLFLTDAKGRERDCIADPATIAAPGDRGKNPARQTRLHTALTDSLDKLRPRQAQILRMNFGIDVPVHSIDEMAEALHISRSAVTNNIKTGLEKLRHCPRRNQLAGYLGI